MRRWIVLKLPLTLQRLLDIAGRNFPLFNKRVYENGGDSSMKEVQNAIIHASPTDPQFINPIPE